MLRRVSSKSVEGKTVLALNNMQVSLWHKNVLITRHITKRTIAVGNIDLRWRVEGKNDLATMTLPFMFNSFDHILP